MSRKLKLRLKEIKNTGTKAVTLLIQVLCSCDKADWAWHVEMTRSAWGSTCVVHNDLGLNRPQLQRVKHAIQQHNAIRDAFAAGELRRSWLHRPQNCSAACSTCSTRNSRTADRRPHQTSRRRRRTRMDVVDSEWWWSAVTAHTTHINCMLA